MGLTSGDAQAENEKPTSSRELSWVLAVRIIKISAPKTVDYLLVSFVHMPSAQTYAGRTVGDTLSQSGREIITPSLDKVANQNIAHAIACDALRFDLVPIPPGSRETFALQEKHTTHSEKGEGNVVTVPF